MPSCWHGFASSVVDLIFLATRGVSDLTNRSAVDPCLGALENSLVTCNQRVSTFESQVASKNAEIAA